MHVDAGKFAAQVSREAGGTARPVVLLCRSGKRTIAAGQASAVFHAVRNLRKPMDLFGWLGANRSDAEWHREDLQRRQADKDVALCSA